MRSVAGGVTPEHVIGFASTCLFTTVPGLPNESSGVQTAGRDSEGKYEPVKVVYFVKNIVFLKSQWRAKLQSVHIVQKREVRCDTQYTSRILKKDQIQVSSSKISINSYRPSLFGLERQME